MSTFEPQAPAPKWAFRWASQGSELLLRTLPVVLPATALLNIVSGVLIISAGIISQGHPLMAYPLAMSIRLLAMIHLFWVLELVMVADGHKPQQSILSPQGIRLMLPLLLVELVLMAVRTIVFSKMADVSSATPSGAIPSESEIIYLIVTGVAWVYANAMSGIVSVMWIVGMLWPPLMVSMGVGLGSFYYHVYGLLQSRLGRDYWLMLMTGFLFVIIVPSLPFWLCQIACMFAMSWLYVAAREIFGGISENGKQKTSSLVSYYPAEQGS